MIKAKLQRSSSLVLTAVLFAFMIAVFPSAYAEGNYGANTSSNHYKSNVNPFYRNGYEGQCTWYAWGRAREKCNVSLTWGDGVHLGNAGTWYANADGAGYSVGTTPRENSIAVWPISSGIPYGHVAFVESVSGSTIYISEYNFNIEEGYTESTINTSTGLRTDTFPYKKAGYISAKPTGYIYLGSAAERVSVMSGVYIIHSARNDNYVLDIYQNSTANDANIQLYEKQANSSVQKFRIIRWDNDYYCIQSMHSGKWLDVALPIEDKANVKLYYENEADEDYWYFEDAGDGYVYIKNKTGYYLDLENDVARNNANIQIYSFVDEDNKSQKWRLEDVTDYYDLADGTYMIHSAINNDYVFDISGNSTENRANIQLYKQENTTVQFYQFTKKGKYYVIRSVYADKWLDIHTPIENNANVQLWESNGAAEEHWVLEDAGNGYVFIRSNADYYLDVQGDQAKNNANIQVYRFAGNNSQKWLLKNIEHKVTFNANGGSGEPSAQTKVLGTELILSKIIPTYDGFTFAGWNSKMDGSGVGYNAGDKYKLDENVTLYAVWITPDCVLPDNLVKIDESAFEGCAFSFAKVQPGTTVISEKAFALCQQLKHIYIPESVTEIASNAFNGVTGLTIHGTKGSYAETYASEKGFAFIEG